jgi:subtilisin family serine protease
MSYLIHYGGKAGAQLRRTLKLIESEGHIAVRGRRDLSIRAAAVGTLPLSPSAHDVLSAFEPVDQYPEFGVEVLRARAARGAKSSRDAARRILKREPALHFAGRVLCDPVSKAPIVYTENAFVKFNDDVKAAQIKQTLKKHKFTTRRAIGYARNAHVISAPAGCGLEMFGLIEQLFEEDAVELLHPELIRRAARKAAFPNQWHLQRATINGKSVDAHAHVAAAWQLSEGAGITIAIIDDGVDIDHEEFRASGKVIAPRDVTLAADNPRPGSGDRHGTACAGVACADGRVGASGVAPKARLMPIRLASMLGSQQEADAFAWAAQNGADVISCSWGPEDGDWWNPDDPLHKSVVPLPDSTRLAIDFAATQGRGGKGCVIFWAAGNGNEPVDNDGYASYAKVIAVGACNDQSKRSAYSDTGNAIWCAFPSSEPLEPRLTPGIWTTDNSGPSGYNPGQPAKGDTAGNYTNSFGGTSSAAPGAAGVAALMLARNPNLRAEDVRAILKATCDKIDKANASYNADGHSPQYGYGRVNARKAVEAAQPSPAPSDRVVSVSARRDIPIRDLQTSRLAVALAENAKVKNVRVEIDIEHTYIGDLQITLSVPTLGRPTSFMLHDRIGGGADNLRVRYDPQNTPALAQLIGKTLAGTWTLIVKDTARADQGAIKSITVEVTV